MAANPAGSEERESSSRWLQGSGSEVLWTGAIALAFIVVGYNVLPVLIRMTGRSGRIESVEWALYLLLGTAFPLLAAVAGWLSVKLQPSRSAIAGIMAVLIVSMWGGWFFWSHGAATFLISLLFAAIVFTVSLRGRLSLLKPVWIVGGVLVLTALWEAAFRIASWTDAAGWMTHSTWTPIVTVLAASAAAVTIGSVSGEATDSTWRKSRLSWIEIPAVVAFLALSFRTTPIVEFYHWSFWVGPMESVRQGGWLLWDVPSQYGFLSILLPALLPAGDAWQALYLFQGALYAITAIAIYLAIATLRPGVVSRLVAFAFTATAFFFRPRTFSLILPAQMTPAGGPMRFFWCYAVLAVLVWKHVRGDKVSDRRFAVMGTLVWVASVAWSAESAIYTTVAWGGAYAVFLLQSFFSRRLPAENETGNSTRRLLSGIILPFAALLSAVALVALAYRAFDGHRPDWSSYYEYALLFSGGYSALPVEVRGEVWYLVVLFIVVSSVVVRFLVRDPANPRLVVAVGAWGTVWGVSSYYVSRSHPVNLLTLVPLLVFSLVIALHLLRSMPADSWSRLLAMAAVPLVAMPIALNLAHDGLPMLLLREQARMSTLTAQMPPMDSSLVRLAAAAGMSSGDPVFYASDGRYLLPRWPGLEGGNARTNSLGWIPKPYEMIGTLPEDRRNTYVNRFRSRVGTGGWLIQKKSEINPAYEGLIEFIEKAYWPVRSFDNDQWLLVRYEPRVLE